MKFINMQDELKFTKKRRNYERDFEKYFEEKEYLMIEPRIFQSYDDFILSNILLDSQKMVKILSGDSKVLILRPDITMNVLERVLKYWESDKPLKIYYNSKIYLNKSDSTIGEYRQIGVEYLGEDSIKADKEIIAMSIEIMKKNNQLFILELGTSKYIDELFNELDMNVDTKRDLKMLIAKKNQNEITKLLSKEKIDSKYKKLLMNLLNLQGDINTVILMTENYYMNKGMEKAIEELKLLRSFFEIENLNKWIHVDLSMVPDLDYYDGIIFKGYYSSSSKKIIFGGRYDSLTEKFKKKVPAIGFSINMDEMIRFMI